MARMSRWSLVASKLFVATCALGLLMTGAGCTTTGQFVVPDGAELSLQGRPVSVGANGTVVTEPFNWSAAGTPPGGGIRYTLSRDGSVMKEGRLRAVFRGAALFWPPIYGIVAWPMGLNPHITYDLVNDTQE